MTTKQERLALAREGFRAFGDNLPTHRTHSVRIGLGLERMKPIAQVALIGTELTDDPSTQTILGMVYGLAPRIVVYEAQYTDNHLARAPWGHGAFGFLERAERRRPHLLYTLQSFQTERQPSRIMLARTDRFGSTEAHSLRKAGYAHMAILTSTVWEPCRRATRRAWSFGILPASWQALTAHVFPLLSTR